MPTIAAPGRSVPAPGFSPPALPDPLMAAPDVIPPPADLPWARPGAPGDVQEGAAQEGAAQATAARLSPLASGAAIQHRPGVLPAAPAAPPGPPALRRLPRAARAPEQPVLKALEHALERDGHGTPFSPGEQDALRDVLGTSVADVRVVRRPEVAAALRAARADGLTVGETVFLPHDLPLGSAAGLALAAHEVTHARRAREPLFVPAALTRPDRRAAAPTASDEEGVALATEHAVSDLAGPVWGPARGPAGNGRATAGRGTDAPRRLPGLPAPWEPLPGWETAGPDAPVAVPDRAPAASPVRTPAPLPVAAPPLPAAPAPLWHAAASDRAPAPAATPARPPEDQAVGRRAQPRSSVDLDQVAREVYARLRERLSQELRRLN
ncbi:eCIS core domain-containing protein [Deinococcus kurensis]|uniref:eCIS core domain-containing protein n=1 Tax=Deinococcus kurensis TaxID=2662757 RepID=UPI0012D302DE|nr:DUF4157 domain-containing protein [Deinococcus kurensis]